MRPCQLKLHRNPLPPPSLKAVTLMPDLTMIVFGALGVIMIFAGIAMTTSRNVIHAAYWLFALAILTAGVFALLHAGFVAVIQLLVYAGAVAILTVFTVMLTLRDPDHATRPQPINVPALLLAITLFGLIVYAILDSGDFATVTLDVYPGLREFAEGMFAPDGWALPFEVASLILTTALITAVMWTKQDNAGGHW